MNHLLFHIFIVNSLIEVFPRLEEDVLATMEDVLIVALTATIRCSACVRMDFFLVLTGKHALM